jgi:hypothetical protein
MVNMVDLAAATTRKPVTAADDGGRVDNDGRT